MSNDDDKGKPQLNQQESLFGEGVTMGRQMVKGEYQGDWEPDQPDWVMSHLLQHRTITKEEALRLYGVERLPPVIQKLRERRLNVITLPKGAGYEWVVRQ